MTQNLKCECCVDCGKTDRYCTCPAECDECGEVHPFSECGEHPELVCSECECKVILAKYITTIDGKQYCGGCNPNGNVDTSDDEYE